MFEHSSLSEDVEHLKGLDPSFSSQVDLVLCASDCSHVVGFPVHSVIISSHSPVLSQFIQELHKEKDSTKQQLPRFPMVDDDCSAIRNMLKCMYGGLPRANSQQAVPRFSQGSEELETIPIEASKMRLTHKYGMLAIKQEQEMLLLPPLHQLVHATALVSQAGKMCTLGQQCTLVLETAFVAEECKCTQLLAVCEAFIAQHFDEFTAQSYALSNTLSSASLLRVAQGLSMFQKNTISTMDKALGEAESETRNFSKTYFQQGMICPQCSQRLDCSNKRNACHFNRSSSCKWPRGHATPPALSVSEISKKLLQLMEIPQM